MSIVMRTPPRPAFVHLCLNANFLLPISLKNVHMSKSSFVIHTYILETMGNDIYLLALPHRGLARFGSKLYDTIYIKKGV